MIISALILLAFLSGVFVVWKYGRMHHYDEARVIDLVLLSSSLAVLASRIGYFFLPESQFEITRLQSMPDITLLIIGLFQLNAGAIWWVGVVVFFVVELLMLWRWRWPIWPMVGVLAMAFAITISLKEAFLWYWYGLTMKGVVLILSLVIATVLGYILMLSGSSKFGLLLQEIRERARIAKQQRIHKKSKKEEDHHSETLDELPKDEQEKDSL